MLYACAYCETLTDGEHTVKVGVNPDETDYLYDDDVVLCDECGQKLKEGIEGEEIKEAARESLTEYAYKEEGIDTSESRFE